MPSSDFVVQFIGEIAAKNCDLALRSQRKPDRTWENFFACTPGQTWTQVYLGPDKNNCQITKEVATKRMGTVIEAFQGVPAEALTIARREGCVFGSMGTSLFGRTIAGRHLPYQVERSGALQVWNRQRGCNERVRATHRGGRQREKECLLTRCEYPVVPLAPRSEPAALISTQWAPGMLEGC